MIWKDLNVGDFHYDKIIDDEMKEKYKIMPCGKILNVDEIDIAHIFIKSNSLWVINNYESVGHPKRKNIVKNSVYFLEINSKDIKYAVTLGDYGCGDFIIMKQDSSIECFSYDITKHEDFITNTGSKILNMIKSIVNKDRFIASIKSIRVNDDKTGIIFDYYDRFNYRNNENPTIYTLNFLFSEIYNQSKKLNNQ